MLVLQKAVQARPRHVFGMCPGPAAGCAEAARVEQLKVPGSERA